MSGRLPNRSSTDRTRRTYLKGIAGATVLGLGGVGTATAAEAESPALGEDGVKIESKRKIKNRARLGFWNQSLYELDTRQTTTIAYTPSPSNRNAFHFWVHSQVATERVRNLDDDEPADGKANIFNEVYLDVSTTDDAVSISTPTDSDRFGVIDAGGDSPDLEAAAEEVLEQGLGDLSRRIGWLTTGVDVLDHLGVNDALFGDSDESDIAGFRLGKTWSINGQSQTAIVSPWTVTIPEGSSHTITIKTGAVPTGHGPESRGSPLTEYEFELDDNASWTSNYHGDIWL